MTIAAAYENGEVFQHFGRTGQFKIYRVENGAVERAEIVDTEGAGHGALAGFLKARGVEALICGGIGPGAQAALAEAGIMVYPGIDGSADGAAEALAQGRLVCKPDALCGHHGHEHRHGTDCGHGTGAHGCGHGACEDANG